MTVGFLLSLFTQVPIIEEGVTHEDILESFATFGLDDAHCYNPNEEERLKGVIRGVGEEAFVARIRGMATRFKQQATTGEDEEKDGTKAWSIRKSTRVAINAVKSRVGLRS